MPGSARPLDEIESDPDTSYETDVGLVNRALRSKCLTARSRTRPREVASDLFSTGSSHAAWLCRRAGIDPYQTCGEWRQRLRVAILRGTEGGER